MGTKEAGAKGGDNGVLGQEADAKELRALFLKHSPGLGAHNPTQLVQEQLRMPPAPVFAMIAEYVQRTGDGKLSPPWAMLSAFSLGVYAGREQAKGGLGTIKVVGSMREIG